MLGGLAKWFAGLVIGRLGNLIQAIIKDFAARIDQRERGRAEQRADSLAKQRDDDAKMDAAADEASQRHNADPTDDAFDQDFKRG